MNYRAHIPFRLITVSREFGSGGTEIARRMAYRLDWKLVDDSLLERIARRAHVPYEVARRYDECVNSWFQQLVGALWRGGFEGSASRVEDAAFDADHMTRLWMEVILETAELGQAIIVGHGGQCVLAGRKDTFHVSVHAPLGFRIQNLRQEFGRREFSSALVQEADRRRAAYLRHYFGEDWKDFRLYHLMIDSSIGLDRAADTILAAAALLPSVNQSPHREVWRFKL